MARHVVVPNNGEKREGVEYSDNDKSEEKYNSSKKRHLSDSNTRGQRPTAKLLR
jgi:hypothetical protein